MLTCQQLRMAESPFFPRLSPGSTLLISLFCLVLILGTDALSATYYVATNGSDAWSGTQDMPNSAGNDGPFSTLQRARDAIRTSRIQGLSDGGGTVFIREGTYHLTSTFILNSHDGGTTNNPLIFKAFPGEKPLLLGALPILTWTPWTNQILRADVRTQGFDGISFQQLFFGGTRQTLARYPNLLPSDPHRSGWTYVQGDLVEQTQSLPTDNKRIIHCSPGLIHSWSRPSEAQAFIFPRYNWWNNILSVISIDETNNIITLAQDADFAIRPGDRFFLQNILEELDSPGEWYLDSPKGFLYFWPPQPITNATVYGPVLTNIIRINPGAHNVQMIGLRLQYSQGTAVLMSHDTTNCLVAASTIRNVGGYKASSTANGSAIHIDGGVGNGVLGCDISDVGLHGIAIFGGDTTNLVSANNFAQNNYIHHFGVVSKQGAGISIHGAGNHASHNYIHDGPRIGIECEGNNLTIEYNHIRNVNLETDDSGIIYTYAPNWILSRGTKIQYNYLHNSVGYGFKSGQVVQPYSVCGVFLDDNAAGVDVAFNVIANCSRSAIYLNNARDNLIYNNFLFNCATAQVKLTGWLTNYSQWIVNLPVMTSNYESVYTNSAWINMRGMSIHPTNAVLPGGLIMANNHFFRNIVAYASTKSQLYDTHHISFACNTFNSNSVFNYSGQLLLKQTGAGLSFSTNANRWDGWLEMGMDSHSKVGDPKFADYTTFTLDRDSPALQLGIQQIPFAAIGVYSNSLRASWPITVSDGTIVAMPEFLLPASILRFRALPTD